MCSRTRRACRARCVRRDVVVLGRLRRRGSASSGAFESTTRFLPPGSFTIEVGTQQPALVVAARSPARRSRSAASIPASSTTRFSCISPQRPRTCGARSAVTRLPVSLRRCSWPCATVRSCSSIEPTAVSRFCSSACACCSNRASVSEIGWSLPPRAAAATRAGLERVVGERLELRPPTGPASARRARASRRTRRRLPFARPERRRAGRTRRAPTSHATRPEAPSGESEDEGHHDHGPQNATSRVGRPNLGAQKNQPRLARRPTGAECRIQRVRRPTGSDVAQPIRRPQGRQWSSREKTATSGIWALLPPQRRSDGRGRVKTTSALKDGCLRPLRSVRPWFDAQPTGTELSDAWPSTLDLERDRARGSGLDKEKAVNLCSDPGFGGFSSSR